VLVNLVYNALKHADAANVRLSAIQSGARIRFQVSDNGSGIPEAIQSHLFEAFYRPKEGPVEDKGLGLGLAIVKELTELMGGRCGVQSVPGGGSDFWVELPSRPPPRTLSRNPPSKTEPSLWKTVCWWWKTRAIRASGSSH